MKLREFFYLLGIKPSQRPTATKFVKQVLEDRTIRYAQWLHPRAYSGEVLPEEVARLKSFLSEGDVASILAHTWAIPLCPWLSP